MKDMRHVLINHPSAYAQCRTQVDGSWTPADIGASWECQNPGDTATGTVVSAPSSPAAAGGAPSGTSASAPSSPAAAGSAPSGSPDTSSGGGSTDSKSSKPNPQSQNFAKLAPGTDKISESDGSGVLGSGSSGSGSPAAASSPAAAASSPPPAASSPAAGGSSGGGSASPAAGGSQAPMEGGCGSTSAPGGWDGVASTSVGPLTNLFPCIWLIIASTVLWLDGLCMRLRPSVLAMEQLTRRLQWRRQPKAVPRQHQRWRPA